MIKSFVYSSLFLLSSFSAFSQTIEEKKAYFDYQEAEFDSTLNNQLQEVNDQLATQKSYLEYLYTQAEDFYEKGSPLPCFKELLAEINRVKQLMKSLEKSWHLSAKNALGGDSHALWHQPETTLGQLIIDYGSQEYVYLMAPEVAAIKVCVDSQLPIPKESWNEMLELVMAQYGVGFKQLNPYLRKLYLFNKEPLGLLSITNRRTELDLFPDHARICFILTTCVPDPASIYHFLCRFVQSTECMRIHLIGRDFFFIAQVQEIKELLTLYDFIQMSEENKEYKLIPLRRMSPPEMERILHSYFYHESAKNSSDTPYQIPELKVIPVLTGAPALFLMGTKEQVCRAEEMLYEIESELEDPREKIIFWYTCKHAEPEDVAEVLSRIYTLMTCTPGLSDCQGSYPASPLVAPVAIPTALPCATPTPPCAIPSPAICDLPAALPFSEYCNPALVVRPDPVCPLNPCETVVLEDLRDNFIVDPKSGAIIMVIEKDLLCKIKELLKKLDQPTRMVQIEVLLFEKRLNDNTNFGLNLLKIGSSASNTHETSLTWNDVKHHPGNQGILSFFLSRMRGHGLPAYDLAYHFLLSQEDVQINACPSVTTVNQTPAKIALVEEISINTGVFEVECINNAVLKDAYERVQYGITIEILPTIHFPEPCEIEPGEDWMRYVTLDTDITFDTTKPSLVNRPEVTRRNIKNQVRVADGETVILGGLRRKSSHDCIEEIPFLGEIPGFGKLFSNTRLSDTQTEMFIFLTPRIISNNCQDYQRIRCEQLTKRPGDIPAFLNCLLEAREIEKQNAFKGGMKMLFGRMDALSLKE